MMQTYPGVAVILYLTTDESPFSPQMRALTGFGVIMGLFSGVISPAGIWSCSFSLSDAGEKQTLSFVLGNYLDITTKKYH